MFHKILPASLLGLLFASSLVVTGIFSDPMVTGKYFFFSLAVSLLGLWFFARLLAGKGKTKFSFHWPDVALVSFALYGSARAITSPGVSFRQHAFILFACMVAVYFFSRQAFVLFQQPGRHQRVFSRLLFLILGGTALAQVAKGLLQQAGLARAYNANFSMSGFFNNPGPYAIFLSILLPYFLGIFLYGVFTKKSRDGVAGQEMKRQDLLFPPGPMLTWAAGLAIMGTLAVLPLSGSRTAWIAALAGTLFLLMARFRWHVKLIGWIDKPLKKMAAIILVFVLLAPPAYFLFHYKPDSALGRLFIWQTTLAAMADRPVFGHGFDQYQNVHNTYQARYFQENPGLTKEAYLAADDPYAFNDYLQLATELGLPGLGLFLVFAVSLFTCGRGRKKENIAPLIAMARASILAVLASALFSYPMQKIPLALAFFFSAGMVSGLQENSRWRLLLGNRLVKTLGVMGILLVLGFMAYQYRQCKAHAAWKKAYGSLHEGQVNKAFNEYARLYPRLKHDQFFLFNYGAELSTLGHYKQSIDILQETLPLLNDADVYMYLGNSHEGMEAYEKAIEAFERAALTIPHKFYPKYRLLPLYYGMGKEEKAISLARSILQMEPKVPSVTVSKIKKETREFLEVHGEK